MTAPDVVGAPTVMDPPLIICDPSGPIHCTVTLPAIFSIFVMEQVKTRDSPATELPSVIKDIVKTNNKSIIK